MNLREFQSLDRGSVIRSTKTLQMYIVVDTMSEHVVALATTTRVIELYQEGARKLPPISLVGLDVVYEHICSTRGGKEGGIAIYGIAAEVRMKDRDSWDLKGHYQRVKPKKEKKS